MFVDLSQVRTPSVLALALLISACSGSKEDSAADAGSDGATDGTTDGTADGTTDGTADGTTDGSADGAADGGDGGGTGTAQVRLAHFGVFPGDTGTAVDIFINGAASGVTFSFKEATPYVELPAGSYDIDIVPSGGAIGDSVFSVPGFTIADGEIWTAYAAGYVAPTEGGQPFSVFAFKEDHAVPAGQVRVNVVHAAALGALDPVDVWVVDGDCEPTSILLDNFAYGSVAANVDLPSTEINVGFDVGGDATVDACFKIPATITDAVINLYAVNTSDGKVSLVAVLPDGTPVELNPEDVPR